MSRLHQVQRTSKITPDDVQTRILQRTSDKKKKAVVAQRVNDCSSMERRTSQLTINRYRGRFGTFWLRFYFILKFHIYEVFLEIPLIENTLPLKENIMTKPVS